MRQKYESHLKKTTKKPNIGLYQNLEENVVEEVEEEYEMECFATEEYKQDGQELEVQAVRFMEVNNEENLDKTNNQSDNSKIVIQFGDEENFRSEMFNFDSSKLDNRNRGLQDADSQLEIISMNRFVQGKDLKSTSQEANTARSNFVRCNVNKFDRVDNVKDNIDRYINSKSKGNSSSEDHNYTLRSMSKSNNNRFEDQKIAIIEGNTDFYINIDDQNHELQLENAQYEQEKNIMGNQRGKYFEVVKSKKEADVDLNQLDHLYSTVHKSNQSKLSKGDLDQIDILNLQYLKDKMQEGISKFEQLNEQEKKQIALNNKNLLDFALQGNDRTLPNTENKFALYGFKNTINSSVLENNSDNYVQYIHEPQELDHYSDRYVHQAITPGFNMMSQSNLSHRQFYNEAGGNLQRGQEESASKRRALVSNYQVDERESVMSQTTNQSSDTTHRLLLDEIRMHSQVDIQGKGFDFSRIVKDTSNQSPGKEYYQLPLDERMSYGNQLDQNSREHSLLMGKIQQAVNLL